MSAEAVIRHSSGSFRYIPGGEAYSAGVAAESGYQITGLGFQRALPLDAGFARLDEELGRRGLPASALVGVELRGPQVLDLDGFGEFNGRYRELLADRGLFDGEYNPVARTNVVPVRSAPVEPAISGAFIVQPAARGGVDFVVAGCGEIIGGMRRENVLALGDVSRSGMSAKIRAVIERLQVVVGILGASPDDPTIVNVYTAHEVDGLADLLADGFPAITANGITRYFAKPPVADVEFEMDCRRISNWQLLA